MGEGEWVVVCGINDGKKGKSKNKCEIKNKKETELRNVRCDVRRKEGGGVQY